MKGLVVLMMLVAATAQAYDGQWHWKRAVVVDDVEINVNVTTHWHLRNVMAKHGAETRDAPFGSSRTAVTENGFAILFRNKDTGAYRCEVYVLSSDDVETLEHEIHHCHGFVHN